MNKLSLLKKKFLLKLFKENKEEELDEAGDDDEDESNTKMDSSNASEPPPPPASKQDATAPDAQSTASTPSIDLIDNENIDDESRAEATFQLVIDEFTKFKDNKESKLSAAPCIVRNLPWKILAMSKRSSSSCSAMRRASRRGGRCAPSPSCVSCI